MTFFFKADLGKFPYLDGFLLFFVDSTLIVLDNFLGRLDHEIIFTVIIVVFDLLHMQLA